MNYKKLLQTQLTRPAVLAGACLLAVCAAPNLAQARKAKFQEMPGITSPAAEPETLLALNTPAPLFAVEAPASAPAAIPPAPAAEVKQLYAFKAEELELKTALAQFARANNLNIIPDRDVVGTVTLDVHDLPLEQMLRALLEDGDCLWKEDGGLIRVRNTETKTFNVDYLRLSRTSVGQSSATLASGSTGGGGGSSGGGGGGGGNSGSSGGGSSSSISGASSVNMTASNPVDFWKELKEELGALLTEKGRAGLAINMTAGLVQVTDRPSALKRVQDYLSGVDISVHRQVDLEARIYDVTLNDQFQFGIDWAHVAAAYGGTLGFGAATFPVANGGAQLLDSALGGINHISSVGSTASATPGGNLSTLVFKNFNTQAAVNALAEQGTVEVVSKPRIRTMNNQTAMVKVGEDVPFFNSSTTTLPGATIGTSIQQQNITVNSITIGTILYITPQVSDDNWISLDISPVLTSLKQVVTFGGTGSGTGSTGGSGATAPDLDTKQASTLVRVRDGTTIVIGGLIQTQTAINNKKVPLLGDIPWMGKLFTGTFRFKQKKEMVMFITPHIIRDGQEPPLPATPAEEEWKIIQHVKQAKK